MLARRHQREKGKQMHLVFKTFWILFIRILSLVCQTCLNHTNPVLLHCHNSEITVILAFSQNQYILLRGIRNQNNQQQKNLNCLLSCDAPPFSLSNITPPSSLTCSEVGGRVGHAAGTHSTRRTPRRLLHGQTGSCSPSAPTRAGVASFQILAHLQKSFLWKAQIMPCPGISQFADWSFDKSNGCQFGKWQLLRFHKLKQLSQNFQQTKKESNNTKKETMTSNDIS